jgi:hypothetical protein
VLVGESAWIGELVAGIIYLIVGFRLALLAKRTGERPERLLAIMFAFAGISYIFYVVPLAIQNDALWLPFGFAGRVTYLPAAICLAFFTRSVFRSEGLLSAFLVYATVTLLVVGVAGSVLVMDDWEGYTLSNPFFWLEWVGYTLPFAWAGAEAFAQYGPSRRRQRLGLCEFIVCNRLLLWGIFGIVQVAGSFVLIAMYMDYEVNNGFSGFFDAMTGGLEIIAISLVWLVFFPPRFYQAFIGGSDADESAAEEG